MAVEAITGKQCTITVDATAYTSEIQEFSADLAKPTVSVSTWGAKYVRAGEADYTASGSLIFSPNSGSLAEALNAALADDDAVVDVVVNLDGATWTFSDWKMTNFSVSVSSDDIVTASFSMSGDTPPVLVPVA